MQTHDTASSVARLTLIGSELRTVAAFGLREEGRERYDWHEHTHHQLLYSTRGDMHIDVERTRYFLSPQYAAWIPAGTRHRTTLAGATMASVWFHPRLVRSPKGILRAIAAPPLLREMVWYAAGRWPAGSGGSRLRSAYFRTMALLCGEWLRTDLPFWLPQPLDPQLARGVDYTLAHLRTATAERASAAAAMSPRSFRRHFADELGMPWRQYLWKARLLRAMALLSAPGARVTTVAHEVGFESSSAFATAFAALTLTSPREYQRRVRLNGAD